MQYITTDDATFSCTTGAGLFIAQASFLHRCPYCGLQEVIFKDGYPTASLTHSTKHIQVQCSDCGRVYFSRITCTFDLCQVYHDHGYDFATDLAYAWGLSIGALKHYKQDQRTIA